MMFAFPAASNVRILSILGKSWQRLNGAPVGGRGRRDRHAGSATGG